MATSTKVILPLAFSKYKQLLDKHMVPLQRSNMFSVYTRAAIFESLTFRVENPTSGGVPAEMSNLELGNSHFLWLLQ